jgi:uncharacterized protein YoxC
VAEISACIAAIGFFIAFVLLIIVFKTYSDRME